MLFENGRSPRPSEPYREALRYRPDSPLLRYGLARALMEEGGDAKLKEAVALLRRRYGSSRDNGGAWRFLGIAEGQAGEEGEASLSLAEQPCSRARRRRAALPAAGAAAPQAHDPDWYRAAGPGSGPSTTSRNRGRNAGRRDRSF